MRPRLPNPATISLTARRLTATRHLLSRDQPTSSSAAEEEVTKHGIKYQAGRQRKLDPILLSGTSRKDVPLHRAQERSNEKRSSLQPTRPAYQRQSRPRGDRQNAPALSQRPKEDESVDFFVGSPPTRRTQNKKKATTIDDELLAEPSEAITARFDKKGPRPPRSQSRGPRPNRQPQNNTPSGSTPTPIVGAPTKSDPRGGRNGRNDRGPSRKRDDKGAGSTMPVRETERAVVKLDQSPNAMFGKQSLVSPILRAARAPETSHWASGLEAGEARKKEVLRLAGSYDVYKPKFPTSSKSPAKDAKGWGAFVVALNNSIGLRKSEGGNEVLERYLK